MPFNPDNNPPWDTDPDDARIADAVAALGCLSCLAGFRPYGFYIYLGLVYESCPHCRPYCGSCNNQALFTADSLDFVIENLAELHQRATCCQTCFGFLHIEPS